MTFLAPITLDEWLGRDLPPPDYMVGKWLTTTTRAILNAPTGLGKTNLGMALSGHAAAGVDFLHWRIPQPRRVLFIDGEMSRRLLKQRLEEMVKRLGCVPESFFPLSREDVLDAMPPLNTTEGQQFLISLIADLGGVDLITFDNVMSLIEGSMKEEEPWQAVLPLIQALTEQAIGQLWIHHTGHDTTKGYGSKTREWQMDTVIHLTKVERPDTDLSFSLSFPKARERTPETRRDFESVNIALVNDEWTTSALTKEKGKVSPLAEKFLGALHEAISDSTLKWNDRHPAANTKDWEAICIRKGLIDSQAKPNVRRAKLSKYRAELIAADRIANNHELIWCL